MHTLFFLLFVLCLSVAADAATYYVDSANAAGKQDGRTEGSAWSSLSQVNETTFKPGDIIAFKRGSTFSGTLTPKGSGSPGAPIVISTYGKGARPRIDGGGNEAVVKLNNQQWWEVTGLDITGGTRFGLWITGDQAGTLEHLYVRDCEVHDIQGTPRWDCGLVVIIPNAEGVRLRDVVVDGVSAHDTNLWYGIHVGRNFTITHPSKEDWAADVVVRNCSVHDVYGDNITVFQANGVLIEKNVAWNGGKAPADIPYIYTPNAIWCCNSSNVVIQFNEAYGMSSYDKDGGAFDIDWDSTNTLIQYNYAHDNIGYGVAIFGGIKSVTKDSVVRYNVFAHNGSRQQAEILIFTWDEGSLDGFSVYGNTIITETTAIRSYALKHTNAPMTIQNNILITSSETLMGLDEPALVLDHNIGWRLGGGAAAWQPAWGIYADPRLTDVAYHGVGISAKSWQLGAGSPAIGAGAVLNDMGKRDFFGNAVPAKGPICIGAHQR